ncbi:glycerophosphocholine cholinephosphodiesterase ENPP6-like [Penaeus japonicus]|uniref:glycerophosphocholine cholinephosphodiesterase ENPP6-like n=1 Tax=Penaeus japonicus TaxID=27405 RepID=UPI001C70BED5|nr:glycerophosphocholine cholinephosphodiesterase ENPP6-like [Penaeus japonicus]
MQFPVSCFFFLTAALWAEPLVAQSSTPATNTDAHDLIVILLDGFRWDYLDIHSRSNFPGFDRFIDNGVRAEYLNPTYPPNSFPNWHTIVTGLYPESHGIVGNFIYDEERNASFNLDRLETTTDPIWWQDSEPLWITTTKAGLDTALFLWSRCDVPWEGNVLPRYCVPFVKTPANSQLFLKNLNQAVDMIQNEGYKLAMVYESMVDTQGHAYGPGSPEITVALQELDVALQGLWEELASRDMLNTTNVVVLSDHGMTDVGPKDKVWLDLAPCLDFAQVVKTVEHAGYINILPAKGYTDQVEESLKNCPGVGENIEVVRKEDMKERYHYKDHRLIHEIIVFSNPGFYIKSPGTNYSLPEQEGTYLGHHGFDNTLDQLPDMRGILFAWGPSFVSGHQSGAVDQVDVYGLLCRALQLTCHAYNGTMEHVEDFFDKAISSAPFSSHPSFLVYMIIGFTSLIAIAVFTK